MVVQSLGKETLERMDAVRGTSPTAARRRLGAVLREFRERAGLTLDDAGKPLQRSAATISRLENGKVKPRLIDVGALVDLFASAAPGVTDDERALVLDLAADSRREAWFSPFRDVLAGNMVSDHTRRYVEFETDAAKIETYEPDVVPGLLQTAAYTDAIAARFIPDHSIQQRRRFVKFRGARQDVLTRTPSPLDFRVVLGEQVLRRSVGGAAVMRPQLAALADNVRNGLPNVTIQIAPGSLLTQGTIGGPFVVMSFADSEDDDLVYLEGRSGAEYLQSDNDLAKYRDYFRELTERALDQDGTLTAIEEALKELS